MNSGMQYSSQFTSANNMNWGGLEELKQYDFSQANMKKNTKIVKGVEENIFMRKFTQLYSYLSSIDNDQCILFSGKKKAQYFKIDRKTKRRSGFRGVSRNGASWQVLMMINNVKTYIGWYDTEEEGALVYDIVSILFKLRKARTNLSYSKAKLLNLLNYYDHDSKHFKGWIPYQFIYELQMGAQYHEF